MTLSLKNDNTLRFERVNRYLKLILEYEIIKSKSHSKFTFVKEWANARLINKKIFLKYYSRYKRSKQVEELLPQKRGPKIKSIISPNEEKIIEEAIFSILHCPPKDYGYNRTTWRIQDILNELRSKKIIINKGQLRTIIKKAGYKYRNAKKVLTSNDPRYREKLSQITAILSTLGTKDKFFSIDEFGPFSIKMQGGKSLTHPAYIRTIPQNQTTKGSIIITGALELSTNQMIYFYSKKKNTEEIIKLIDLLILKYEDQNKIYLSWDAASWHKSKKLFAKANEHNKLKRAPNILFQPLPSCAQFLNVIESIYSGMCRAIIHNSNYQSMKDCKKAINSYFEERNKYYTLNPKRAGNKLWGKEKVEPRFDESNNCKDSKYLHNFK